jgi:hypothetical protein
LAFTPPCSVDDTAETLIPTILTFVNAHLAAFEEMQERRNADFHDLSKRLLFDPARVANVPYTEPSASALSIYDTDALFWMVRRLCIVSTPSQKTIPPQTAGFALGRCVLFATTKNLYDM